MIPHLAIILALQLIGEVTARSLGLLIPGPVIGMVLFLILLLASPKLAAAIRGTAMGLLAHLSLLFVPAGVGIVGHINSLGADAAILLLVIVLSTAISIVSGAATFTLVCRMMGRTDD
jgi:holin-like protein